MIREYEFRGKDITSGEWVFGYYWVSTAPQDGNKRHHIIQADGLMFDVVPESVGMFTGMKAKDGGKIFEGDFVLYGIHEKKKYLVVYLEVDAGFFLSEKTDWNPCDTRANPLGGKNNYYLKIIGNLTDSPNLLEEANASKE